MKTAHRPIAGMLLLFVWSAIWIAQPRAEEIRTNSATLPNPPPWLTESRVERVIDRVQDKMEWSIRRVTVQWHTNAGEFKALHGYGDSVLAFSRKSDNSIHLGPRVDRGNFDWVFGHELVHIVLYQKYKGAVPAWLDEGLANHVARNDRVDYRWLASQPQPPVRSMIHPFLKTSVSSKYHYMASTALVEMIRSKCDLTELLQLSLGSGLEKYLPTLCKIPDLDVEFKNWIRSRNH